MLLSLSIDTRSQTARITVDGEVDVTTAFRMAHAIERVGRDADVVELDLSGVRFMDAAGIRALEDACDAAQTYDFEMKIVAMSREAQLVLDVTESHALLHC